MSGKCPFLQLSEYQRMQLSPAKQQQDYHTQQQVGVKAKIQCFYESKISK